MFLTKYFLPIILLVIVRGYKYTIDELSLPNNTALVLDDGPPPFYIPFIASIRGKSKGKPSTHVCVGTIIDEYFILTAAHCFIQVSDPLQYEVIVGKKKFGNVSDSKPYAVQKIIVHELFVPLRGHDVALIKLRKPIKFNSKAVSKLDISSSNLFINENKASYLIAFDQKKTFLELISYNTITVSMCRKRKYRHLTITEICAISGPKRGACEGDSGGPLIDSKFRTLYGILSYGKHPCLGNRAFVFTRLSMVLNWIMQKIEGPRNKITYNSIN